MCKISSANYWKHSIIILFFIFKIRNHHSIESTQYCSLWHLRYIFRAGHYGVEAGITIAHHSVHVRTAFQDYKSLKTDRVICILFEEDVSSLLLPIYNSAGFIKWSDATAPWTNYSAFNRAIHLLLSKASALSRGRVLR